MGLGGDGDAAPGDRRLVEIQRPEATYAHGGKAAMLPLRLSEVVESKSKSLGRSRSGEANLITEVLGVRPYSA